MTDLDAKAHRWNIEEDGANLRVCRGLHEKHEGCDWELFVPAAALLRARNEAIEEAAVVVKSLAQELRDRGDSYSAGDVDEAAERIEALKGATP